MFRSIPVDTLNFSNPLPWTIYNRQGKVIARKGSVVNWDNVVASSGTVGELFILATEKEVPAVKATPAPALMVPIPSNPYQECHELEQILAQAMAEENATVFANALEQMVARLEALMQGHFDTVFGMLVLAEGQNYPISHQLHTATLVASLLPKLPYIPKDHYAACVKAALTMNVAMIELQAQLVNQSTELTLEQRQLIRTHPQQGVEMLHRRGVSDPVWLETILQHHERANGMGYPTGRTDVCPTAELVNLADIFCAKVSTRGYRKGITPGQAARELLIQQGGGANPELASLLIREVGVYPPGTFVKLRSGETGIVIRRGLTAVAPKVVPLMSRAGAALQQFTLADTNEKDTSIIGVVPKDKVKMHMDAEKFWGLTSSVQAAG